MAFGAFCDCWFAGVADFDGADCYAVGVGFWVGGCVAGGLGSAFVAFAEFDALGVASSVVFEAVVCALFAAVFVAVFDVDGVGEV